MDRQFLSRKDDLAVGECKQRGGVSLVESDGDELALFFGSGERFESEVREQLVLEVGDRGEGHILHGGNHLRSKLELI